MPAPKTYISLTERVDAVNALVPLLCFYSFEFWNMSSANTAALLLVYFQT